MEKSTEKRMSSVDSGNSINSKLRYPLRSKERKPPVPDSSGSSVIRRGRVTSAVRQSTTLLDLSAKKNVDRTNPPRRLSIPNKTSSNSSVKSVRSSVTSLSERKVKRSSNPRSLNETPVLRSVTRRKVEDLSSSTYWLNQLRNTQSLLPIDKMKEELKSYVRRNNLDQLVDVMKELSELYNISEESKQMQIFETSSVTSVVAEEATNDVQSSFSIPGDSNITSEIMKEDAPQDSAVIETAKEEEEAAETILQDRTRRSLDVINVNQDVSEVFQEVRKIAIRSAYQTASVAKRLKARMLLDQQMKSRFE